MINAYIKKCFTVLILCITAVMLSNEVRHMSETNQLFTLNITSDRFKQLNITCTTEEISTYAESIGADKGELMIVCECMFDGDISSANISSINKSSFVRIRNYLKKKQPQLFNLEKNTYNGLLADIKYFPVPRSNKRKEWVNYVNSWNYERTYNGNRTHEGTDVMGDINKDGIYPVVSVSDGYISNIGWLELGGWRIGITSPSGIYYYYAHLDSYAKEYKEGDVIRAGDIIGYMGSTGYSKVEGTKNKFPVHLHFGIYITPDPDIAADYEEIALNPYNILKINENNTLIYSY
jgi:murein DD-endopeptidase MepM/ murein hydrolase activator NlpD